MENKIKPETTPVIKTLQECEIGTIMATGDNVLTAISVARQCGIIDKNDTVFLGDLAFEPTMNRPFVSWTI
jgi:cation-transporting ATPase 13A2